MDRKEIVDEYQEFVKVAEELTEKDLARYPLERRETKRDRFTRHLIGMMELYSIRYGNINTKRVILSFLERQMFRGGIPDNDGEPFYVSFGTWQDLKKQILSEQFDDLVGSGR